MALGVAAEARKGGRRVLLSRRFHLSKFPDGRSSDIHVRRVVLAIDHRFF
jgi:hypothetical protein